LTHDHDWHKPTAPVRRKKRESDILNTKTILFSHCKYSFSL